MELQGLQHLGATRGLCTLDKVLYNSLLAHTCIIKNKSAKLFTVNLGTLKLCLEGTLSEDTLFYV